MTLTFLGRGCSNNISQGNNSAYFIENNELFLIDCGESVFAKIKSNNLLESTSTVNGMITHTHSDHIGSLGTLILYCYFNIKVKVNIILPREALHKDDIKNLAKIFGCTDEMYDIVDEEEYDNKYKTFTKIRYKQTEHVSQICSYGILFDTTDGLVYYSGDTKEVNNIKQMISSGEKIDKIYMDTTTANTPNNVHLYIGYLNEEIPNELKNKVYCMHFNNDECIEVARRYGFNVVDIKNNEITKEN